MKKFLVITVALLFSLASCIQNDGIQQYKTPFGFLIQCPVEYRIKNADSSMFRLYEDINNLDSPRFSIYPTELIAEGISGTTKEKMIEIVEKSYSISEIGDFESTTANGVQFVSIDVLIEGEDGIKVYLKQAYFSVDGNIYLFLALTNGEDLSSLDRFDSILYSVRPGN